MIAYQTIEVDGTAWGRNDRRVPPVGARADFQDLPEAELHLVGTGYFATSTHDQEIAELIVGLVETHVTGERVA